MNVKFVPVTAADPGAVPVQAVTGDADVVGGRGPGQRHGRLADTGDGDAGGRRRRCRVARRRWRSRRAFPPPQGPGTAVTVDCADALPAASTASTPIVTGTPHGRFPTVSGLVPWPSNSTPPTYTRYAVDADVVDRRQPPHARGRCSDPDDADARRARRGHVRRGARGRALRGESGAEALDRRRPEGRHRSHRQVDGARSGGRGDHGAPELVVERRVERGDHEDAPPNRLERGELREHRRLRDVDRDERAASCRSRLPS